MSATVIDGRAIGARLREQVAVDVAAFVAAQGRPPGLATVLIGDDPASAVYVAGKHRACAEAGIESFHRELAADVEAPRRWRSSTSSMPIPRSAASSASCPCPITSMVRSSPAASIPIRMLTG